MSLPIKEFILASVLNKKNALNSGKDVFVKWWLYSIKEKEEISSGNIMNCKHDS